MGGADLQEDYRRVGLVCRYKEGGAGLHAVGLQGRVELVCMQRRVGLVSYRGG